MGAYIVKMSGISFTQAEELVALQLAFNTARFAAGDLQPINFSVINGSRFVTVGTVPAGIDAPSIQLQNPINGSSLFNIEDSTFVNTAVVLKVYAEGVLVYAGNVRPNLLGRLPSGFKAHVWQFELLGNDDVYSLAVAEVPKELIKV
jgi:hypothetical protein